VCFSVNEYSSTLFPKSYPQRLVMTPLERPASLPDANTFLKPGTTLAHLQAEATRVTDNQAAQ
jgi:hypothetical protein